MFMAFAVLAIVGIIFVSIVVGIVGDQTNLLPNTETNLVYNGSIDINLVATPVNTVSSFVDNSTGATLVEGANYTLTKTTGLITNGTGNVITTGTVATGYDIVYTSEPAGFINPGVNRTVLFTLPLLFMVVFIVFMLSFRFTKKE